jgi:hypothetical protein
MISDRGWGFAMVQNLAAMSSIIFAICSCNIDGTVRTSARNSYKPTRAECKKLENRALARISKNFQLSDGLSILSSNTKRGHLRISTMSEIEVDNVTIARRWAEFEELERDREFIVASGAQYPQQDSQHIQTLYINRDRDAKACVHDRPKQSPLCFDINGDQRSNADDLREWRAQREEFDDNIGISTAGLPFNKNIEKQIRRNYATCPSYNTDNVPRSTTDIPELNQ